MRKRNDYRNDFSLGQISEEFTNAPEEVLRSALKTGQNLALLSSGSVARRPGSIRLAAATNSRAVLFKIEGGFERLHFTADGVSVLDEAGALLQILAGPWSADDVDIMQISAADGRLDIASNSFWPQTMLRLEDGSWIIGDFGFAYAEDGGAYQPYFRYADGGITMEVSSYTGSATIEFSEDILTEDWEGIRVRYLTREIEIDEVTSASTANVTIIQTLYPTITVTIASSIGFSAGELVQGDTSGLSGIVSQVVDGTHMRVLMRNSYSTFADAEPLIGPRAKTTVTSTTTYGLPAITSIWDEAMMGPHRGYPASVTRHRGRLLFGGFPKAGPYLAASVVRRVDSFDLGTGTDADAGND